MSSQGSVTTARAAGAGGGLPPVPVAKPNKMKLDMPPRPVKTHSRKPSGGPSSAMSATGAQHPTQQQQQQGGAMTKDDGSVPHVVRVTFLGVAGLLAKTPAEDRATSPSDGGEPSMQPLNSPASSDHPSLLFPLPKNMRVVASVSRSRTARGIPSGISKCLASSSGGGSSSNKMNTSEQTQPPSSLLSPSSTAAHAGSFALSPIAGEKIVVEKQPSKRINSAPMDEVSINTPLDELLDNSDPNKNIVSSAKNMHRRKGSKGSSSFANPAPPSQLLHSRTSSTRRSEQQQQRGRASSAGGSESLSPSIATGEGSKAKSTLSLELETGESIEVIRPYSPSMGTIDQMRKKLPGGKKGGGGDGSAIGETSDAASDLPPERFVAVWDENSRHPLKSSAGGTASANTQFVNLTNSLAFEAELRPSSSLGNTATEEGRTATPVASTTFAPKAFCVTVGLVPDFDEANDNNRGQSSTPVLDEIGERMESPSKSKPSVPPPTFAIPVGFADLVINGDETLDGRRQQFDLPLSSLSNFLGSIGGEKLLEKGDYPFPLIELTADGLVAANKTDESKKETAVITKQSGKVKKKSIVKRMLMRKQKSPSASSASSSPTAAASRAPVSVYNGQPKSIFHLDRPPNAKERTLFLDRYSVDPSGDAVVRVGLEVFPRGSELEKIFRQKNKLRKKAQAAAAASAAVSGSSSRGRSNGRFSPASMGSRTVETADSRSLMDDDDEEAMLSSDCSDSVYSQSFFTLDSNASRTTWDESTMYTDALSSFNTIDDDSMSYTTGMFSEYDKSRAERRSQKTTTTNFFTTLLNCNGPTACGDVDDEDIPMDESERRTPTRGREKNPYSNIDQVASAVASMSMAEADDAIIHTKSASPHHKSAASIASMETATRHNHRATSQDSIKERGEELTLDTISPVAAAAAAKAGGGKGGNLPPLDTAIAIESRQGTAHTVSNEPSPLAVIKQRAGDADIDELDDNNSTRPQNQLFDDEGHEFTLEDHQSASM